VSLNVLYGKPSLASLSDRTAQEDIVETPEPNIEREFWDARELQELTGVSRNTWLHWAWIGKGPPSFKLGGRRLWRRSVVEDWIAEREEADGGSTTRHVD
jgi:prophage regulatory protein